MNTINTLAALKKFAEEREWQKFHTPENLAKSITIEAAELLECFQWGTNYNPAEVQDELADVLSYCYQLCLTLELDPNEIVLQKIAKTAKKYPLPK